MQRIHSRLRSRLCTKLHSRQQTELCAERIAQAAEDFASLKAAKTEEMEKAQAMVRALTRLGAQLPASGGSIRTGSVNAVDSPASQVDSKTQELADTCEKNEAAKQNKADTEDALAADSKFLADLKVCTCLFASFCV